MGGLGWKEAAGEEVEGYVGAATRPPDLSARLFIPCTATPQLSPSHWIRFAHSILFFLSSFTVPLHAGEDAFIFVVEKRSRGEQRDSRKEHGLGAQESWSEPQLCH